MWSLEVLRASNKEEEEEVEVVGNNGGEIAGTV
jgi:hypothetical protein